MSCRNIPGSRCSGCYRPLGYGSGRSGCASCASVVSRSIRSRNLAMKTHSLSVTFCKNLDRLIDAAFEKMQRPIKMAFTVAGLYVCGRLVAAWLFGV